MKKALLILLVIPVVLILTFCGISLVANPHFEGSMSTELPVKKEVLWQLLNDPGKLSSKRHEVKKVELLENNELGYQTWTEDTGPTGLIHLEIIEKQPEESMVVEMTESDFGMTGTWQFELSDTETGCALTIHENSTTEGFVMRGFLTLVGRDGNLRLQLMNIENVLTTS